MIKAKHRPSGSEIIATSAERTCHRNRAQTGDDDKLFQQLVAEVVDGAVDKLAAVVGGDHFNPFRQAALQRRQLRFDRGDHFAGVLAGAQDHHAAGHFAFAVKLGDSAAHLRADLHPRDVAKIDRHAVIPGFQHDILKSSSVCR